MSLDLGIVFSYIDLEMRLMIFSNKMLS
jgi:hypothetical protein